MPKGPTSAESWAKLVKQDIDNATLRQLVLELEEAKRHEDVISLLEQLILAGKAQPWVYETLALTMEVAGRPRAQVERVLLSMRDLVPANASELLFLAAYLARFERYSQAIRCCRQAAELEPTRAEPYLEALRFASKARLVDDRAWAAVGVILYAWGSKRTEYLDLAEDAVTEVREAWGKAADGQAKLVEFDRALAEARRCDLHLRLEWTGAGELDLLVDEPAGTTCSRETPLTTSGGVLVHDGLGPKPENCYDEYVCPQAWSGEYKVRIRHGWGQIVGKRARLIVIRNEGSPQQEREIINVNIGGDDVIVRVSLRQGRRQKVAVVHPAIHIGARPAKVQQTVAQRLDAANISGQLGPGGGFGGGQFQGGNAVGYQPVIQFINEGVTMSALATVSGDRRYVRITTQPVFSDITDVFTFSFQR